MAASKILLKAEANQLGIPGYRTMSEAQLRTAIATAKGGSSKGKGKTATATSDNGVKGKGKAAPAKGKTTSPAVKGKGKSAPAKKSTAKKSTPAVKGKASQGTAKRPATAKKPVTKGKVTAPKKGTQTTKPKSTRRKPGQPVGRATIDRSSIDWKAESNVGRTGKRHDVLVALRKHKGNYDKVFEALKPNAVKWYPTALNSYPNESNNKRHAAERMLRWLINRVALDFAKKTGQHQSGTRAGYGESKKPSDIRRRELREQHAVARAKAERAARRTAPTKGSAKKPAARKPAAAKGKAPARKTAAKPSTKGKGATAKGKGKR